MTASNFDVKATMDHLYPEKNWKKILKTIGEETICVPPCTDVQKSAYHGSYDGAPLMVRGQNGETEFMQRFVELKLGGVLINGLKTADLQKVGENQDVFQHLKDGECDFIFIHQILGIFVIEVKGANSDTVGELQIKKAKSQLVRNITNIVVLYEILFNEKLKSIFGIIFMDVKAYNKTDYTIQRFKYFYSGTSPKIIEDTDIGSPENLKETFTSISTRNLPCDQSLIRQFAIELVCCRTKVVFHSQAFNAMQIAQWIQAQDFKSDKEKRRNNKAQEQHRAPGNGIFGTIFLTEKQLEIFKCDSKCISVRGAPGSGKTLIVMLRALEASKKEKKGSKIFVLVNEALIAKYEYFFEDERHQNAGTIMQRNPVISTIDRLRQTKPEDDVFFDETPVNEEEIEKIKERVTATGQTFVVFTGLDKPQRANVEFQFYERELTDFNNFELNVVLRGTKTIFDEWRKYFSPGLTIGHSISGVSIDRPTFDSTENVQQFLLKQIADLLNTVTFDNINYDNLPRLCCEHIGIITSHDEDAEIIRRFLSTNGIPNGSVEVQVRDTIRSIVAVDNYVHTLSYEWPIVFIVFRRGDPAITMKNVISIAASRCMAKLSIIEHENRIQKSIDGNSIGMQPLVRDDESNQSDAASSTSNNELELLVQKSPSETFYQLIPDPDLPLSVNYARKEKKEPWIFVTLAINKYSHLGRNLQKFIHNFVAKAQANGLKLTYHPEKYYTKIPVDEIQNTMTKILIVIDGIHKDPSSIQSACSQLSRLASGKPLTCKVPHFDKKGVLMEYQSVRCSAHPAMVYRYISAQQAVNCIAEDEVHANNTMNKLTQSIADLFKQFEEKERCDRRAPFLSSSFIRDKKKQWIQVNVFRKHDAESAELSKLFFATFVAAANVYTEFNIADTNAFVVNVYCWDDAFDELHEILDNEEHDDDDVEYIFAIDDYPKKQTEKRAYKMLPDEFPNGPGAFTVLKDTAIKCIPNSFNDPIAARQEIADIVHNAYKRLRR